MTDDHNPSSSRCRDAVLRLDVLGASVSSYFCYQLGSGGVDGVDGDDYKGLRTDCWKSKMEQNRGLRITTWNGKSMVKQGNVADHSSKWNKVGILAGRIVAVSAALRSLERRADWTQESIRISAMASRKDFRGMQYSPLRSGQSDMS